MNKHLQYLLVLAAVMAAISLPAGTAMSQEEVIEEIVTTGSRSQKERTAFLIDAVTEGWVMPR